MAALLTSNSYSQSRVLGCFEMRLYTFEAIMTSSAALGLETQLAKLEGDLIHQNQGC